MQQQAQAAHAPKALRVFMWSILQESVFIVAVLPAQVVHALKVHPIGMWSMLVRKNAFIAAQPQVLVAHVAKARLVGMCLVAE